MTDPNEVVDVDSGEVKWSLKGVNGSSSVGDVVYASCYQHMVALDVGTGASLWRYRAGWMSNPSAPVVADGRVFFSYDDDVVALSSRGGKLIWRVDVTGDGASGRVTGAAVCGDILVVTTSGRSGSGELAAPRLMGLDASTGKRRWALANQPGAAFETGPAVVDSKVLTVDSTGELFKLNGLTGEVLLEIEVVSSPRGLSEICADSAMVYFVERKRGLFAFNHAKGAHAWKQHVGKDPTDPLMCGESIIIAASCNLQAFHAESGQKLWSIPVEKGTATHLSGTDEVLVCTGGGFEAFGRSTKEPVAPAPTSRLRPL
ncbi:outer membrane protein assembly factor BamB family protein [Streptomyces adustus]